MGEPSRLGVTTALSSADGDPTFIFGKSSVINEGGLVALMVENRWKAEEEFREALKSALAEPTDAENSCDNLERLGFNTAVVWSDAVRAKPTLVFERSPIGGLRPEAIEKVDEIVDRFETDAKFEDEMIGYLVGVGAAYGLPSPQPMRNVPSQEASALQGGLLGNLSSVIGAANDGEKRRGLNADPAMDAAIEAKVEAAIAAGMDPALFLSSNASDQGDVLDRVGFTQQEQDYMAKRSVLNMVKVEVGRMIMETLHAANFRIVRDDLIPSLTAYFEAVDAGEIEAVA